MTEMQGDSFDAPAVGRQYNSQKDSASQSASTHEFRKLFDL